MNLSQLAESGARREEAQLRVRHHAALIAGIICRIWQGRTRIGPSVRQRPPRFSNITESVGCLHVPHQVVPGTLVEYAFLFSLFSASGGWVKIKLELPQLLTRMYQIHVCLRFNPRSGRNLGKSSTMKARLQEEVRLVGIAQGTRVRYTEMGVFSAVAGNQ